MPSQLRAAIRAAIGLIVIELVWLAGANALLQTAWVRAALNRRPDVFQMDFGHSWTPWPGRVRFTDFHIRGQSKATQWSLQADQIDGFINPVALAFRRFSATDVEGVGVVVRVRRRIDAPGGPRVSADVQPDIEGYANPPEKVPHPSNPASKPWTIRLGRYHADSVREVWIEEFRVRGVGEANGGFRIRIREKTRIDQTRLKLHHAELAIAGEPVASGITTELDVSTLDYEPSQTKGWALLPFIDFRGRLACDVPDFGFARLWLRRVPQLQVTGGGGHMDAVLNIEEGQVRPGTLVTLTPTADVRVTFLNYELKGPAQLKWESVPEDPAPTMRLQLDQFALRRAPARKPHVYGEQLALTARSANSGLLQIGEEVTVRAKLTNADVPDLTYYNSYLPKGLDLEIIKGRGRVSGVLDIDTTKRRGSTRISLSGQGVSTRHGALEMQGDFALEARLRTRDLRFEGFDLSGTSLRILDASVINTRAAVGGRRTAWWGNGRITSGTFQRSNADIDANVEATVRDLGPLIAFVTVQRDLPGWLVNTVPKEGLSGHARIQLDRNRLLVNDMEVGGDEGELEVRARLKATREAQHALLFAEYGHLRIGVERLPERTTRLKVRNPRHWFETYRPF